MRVVGLVDGPSERRQLKVWVLNPQLLNRVLAYSIDFSPLLRPIGRPRRCGELVRSAGQLTRCRERRFPPSSALCRPTLLEAPKLRQPHCRTPFENHQHRLIREVPAPAKQSVDLPGADVATPYGIQVRPFGHYSIMAQCASRHIARIAPVDPGLKRAEHLPVIEDLFGDGRDGAPSRQGYASGA